MEDKRDDIIISYTCTECNEMTSTELNNVNIIVQFKEGIFRMIWEFECKNCFHSWTCHAETKELNLI